jgi:hypothetical protein
MSYAWLLGVTKHLHVVKQVSGLLLASPISQMYCFAHPHFSRPNLQDKRICLIHNGERVAVFNRIVPKLAQDVRDVMLGVHMVRMLSPALKADYVSTSQNKIMGKNKTFHLSAEQILIWFCAK